MSRERQLPLVDPEALAKEIDELRAKAIFEDTGDTVLTPQAEQHYLLAIAALDQAARHMKLAEYLAIRKE